MKDQDFENRPTQYVYVCIIVLSMSFRNFQNLSRVLQVIAPLHPSPFYYPTFSNHAPLQIPKRPWVLPLGKTWCLCTMPWAQLPWPWPWAPVGCAAAAAWPWAPWAGWVRCGRSWGHRPLISSSPWESLWHGYYNVCIYMCNCVTYILVGGLKKTSWKIMDFVNGKDDIPCIMENKSHVWNHQPVYIYIMSTPD